MYVQEVWVRWQGVIVGALASITSFFIFQSSRKQEELKRKRALQSAKSSLPKALSDLHSYCKECVPPLKQVWYNVTLPSDRPHTRLGFDEMPKIPIDYEKVLHKCIEYENDNIVTDHLTQIQINLQINHSRLKDLSIRDNHMIESPGYILSVIYRLLELYTLINMSFGYARNLSDTIQEKVEEHHIGNSLACLNLDTGDFHANEEENLFLYIKRMHPD